MLETHFRGVGKSFFRLLSSCKNMSELKRMHTQIIRSPHLSDSDRFFFNSRILLFAATSLCGSITYSSAVFALQKNPNRFFYNIMIRAYATKMDNNGEYSGRALTLYREMLLTGITPDRFTFPFILKGCARWGQFDIGRCVHSHVIRLGFHHDLFIQNFMIHMYSSGGLLPSAFYLFDHMPERDIVSWNSMITGFLRNGELDFALDLFRRMEKRNTLSWNSLITGFVQAGRAKEGVELFYEMQNLGDDSEKPDKVTIASALSGCACFGTVHHGERVHDYMKRSGIECDVAIGTALIDMYGRCGCLETASVVFDEMPVRDVLAWTAMVSVLALHGRAGRAFQLFEEMKLTGVKPNHVTFLGLLSACAHSGLVQKGRWCFETMKHVHSIQPRVEHYAVMVDILSRAGLHKEAEELIKSMPMKADKFVWGALLGGCQMHGAVDLGVDAARELIHWEPYNHAFWVSLCDIYSKSGRFEDLNLARAVMKEKGILKTSPGCSLVEINGG